MRELAQGHCTLKQKWITHERPQSVLGCMLSQVCGDDRKHQYGRRFSRPFLFTVASVRGDLALSLAFISCGRGVMGSSCL